MDPRETLKLYKEAMRSIDRPAIGEYADALLGWLDRGGFNPFAETGYWESTLNIQQLKAHLRDMRAVAEMI